MRAERTWGQPQSHLIALFFLMYCLCLKVSRILLHPLSTIAKLIFYWVTVHVAWIFILWHCSLKMLTVMLSLLLRKLGREVLLPVIQIVWQSQLAVQSCCFHFTNAMLYCAARQVLELLRPVPSPPMHPSHHCLDSFFQHGSENYQAELRPLMQQIAVALFLGFLDAVQGAFNQSAAAVKYELTRFLNSIKPACYPAYKESILDDITCSLPLTRIPLCNRFKGPSCSTFKDVFRSIAMLKFVVATEHIIRGPGKYGLEVTTIPLHVRFQSNNKMKNALSKYGTDPSVKQMKKACMVFIAFYLSVLSVITKMVK